MSSVRMPGPEPPLQPPRQLYPGPLPGLLEDGGEQCVTVSTADDAGATRRPTPRLQEDDNVKRLLDGFERLLSRSNRTESQKNVKLSSSGSSAIFSTISESAAVDFGDWLHTIANPMGDVSPNSSVWWKEIMETWPCSRPSCAGLG